MGGRLTGRLVLPPNLALALALAAPLAVGAEVEPPSPAAGGSVAWLGSEGLDLVGTVWADLPWRITERSEIFLGLDTRSSIRKTLSGFTFDVRDLGYTVEIGARHAFRPGLAASVVAGQWGRENVDAAGQPYAQYLGAGLAVGGTGLGGRIDLAGDLQAGVVGHTHEVSADASLRARGRLRVPLPRGGEGRFGQLEAFGLDLDARALLGSDPSSDAELGPFFDLHLGHDHRLTLFARYLRHTTPLGLGVRSAAVGFGYARAPRLGLSRAEAAVAGLERAVPADGPEVHGQVAGGGGEGRLAGKLDLAVASPAFAGPYRIVADVDANVLTAPDTGDLFYLYHVGVTRPATDRLVSGLYFYHRSNHQLAEPSPGITSLNVAEVGLETSSWRRPLLSGARSARDRLAWRARAGWLIDSRFGEDRPWHLRGGARWTLPLETRVGSPFVEVEAERGDVRRTQAAAGWVTPAAVELRIEYRADDQLYGRDPTALLALVATRF